MMINRKEIEHFDVIEEDEEEGIFEPLQDQNGPPKDYFERNKNKEISVEEEPLHNNATSVIDEHKNSRKPNRLNLYFSFFVVNLIYMCTGQCFVWTSPMLPYLQSPDSFLPVTTEQASWIASLFLFGAMVGAPLTHPLADSLGRRWSMMFCALLMLISWAMLGWASDVRVIYASRLISGLAAGVYASIAPIYISEISDDTVRGAASSMHPFSRSCGYVFIYTIGPYVSYQQLVLVSAICPVGCLLLTPLIAESPHYLVAQGHHAQAIKTVQWLRGSKSQSAAEKEVNAIKDYMNHTARNKKSIADLFSTVGNIRAIYLIGGLYAVQQLSGMSVILIYTEPIFLMTESSISASLSALLIGSTMMVSGLVVPPFIKRYGFIWPLIVSTLGCSLLVGLLGLFFFLHSLQIDISYLNWLPITSLFLFIISHITGIGTLPSAVMGEVFPANTKTLAAGILTSFNFLMAFLTAISFEKINKWFGVYWSFWMYAVFCLLAAPFTYYLLPDTQGLSLDQIQHLMNQPWNMKWSRQTKQNLSKVLCDSSLVPNVV